MKTEIDLAHRTAEKNALAAIAGPDGFDAPSISRAGWLQTLLDEIDGTPGIKELLARDDCEGMLEMLKECRALAKEGIDVLRRLSLDTELPGDPDELPLQQIYPPADRPASRLVPDDDGNIPF